MARPGRYALPSPPRPPGRRGVFGLIIGIGVAGLVWWWSHLGTREPDEPKLPEAARTNAAERTTRGRAPSQTRGTIPSIDRRLVAVAPDSPANGNPKQENASSSREPGGPGPRSVETIFEAQVA